MTEAMKITLSTQPADARWGDKATYSINNDGITLHLNGKDDLGLIQRAARKIDGLGIKTGRADRRRMGYRALLGILGGLQRTKRRPYRNVAGFRRCPTSGAG
ncbi:peptidase B [Salmonella enterica]|nr:peptidase B [Salmonella enterica]